MWILGGFPPERKEQMSKRELSALPSTFSSSHPTFCKSRLFKSWELLQRRHMPVTVNSPGHGLFVFQKHPWAPPEKAPGATLWSGGWVLAAAWVNTEERRRRVLLLWLLRQSGEKKCVRGSDSSLSLLPISLLVPCLSWVPRTLCNSVNSETPPA